MGKRKEERGEEENGLKRQRANFPAPWMIRCMMTEGTPRLLFDVQFINSYKSNSLQIIFSLLAYNLCLLFI